MTPGKHLKTPVFSRLTGIALLIAGFLIQASGSYGQPTYTLVKMDTTLKKSGIGKLELIRPDKSGSHFIRVKSARKFVVWGFNYDHDTSGRLIEDYWKSEWEKVVKDFTEMKRMGANTVRIHLQLSRFMKSASQVDMNMIRQLKRLVSLAERLRLYLDITGLGCYHKDDIPEWYNAMNDQDRWMVQSRFWEAIAKTCHSSPAIFCYDLMNEPIVPGENTKEKEWITGEFGGKYFIQRLTLDPAGRSSSMVAEAWIDKLVTAIKKYDKHHMITVGEIPWAYIFPGARSLFSNEGTGKNLDFISVHFYPKKNDITNALKALRVYNSGKPLIIEEMFPLQCSMEELDDFIERSREFTDGWLGFYWGHTPESLRNPDPSDVSVIIIKSWLEYFQAKTDKICPDSQ